MKSSIAILATLSFAQAQSSGWQNTNPSVSQLSQEKFRCGCPMPAPKVTGCQAALPVQTGGCGCQPAECNPKPQVPHPTKVLALQCHDVTSWKQETVTDQVERIRKVKIPKTKTVTRAKMGYKKTTAIRYRQKMVEVDEMKWETRQVQKTTYRTVTENVRVVAPPQTRMDCCGRTVAMQSSPCSCAAPIKYTTKTISKQVPVNSMVTERVQVPCKVKKMVNEPYEVTVNMPMPGTETVQEKYFEYKDERYTEPVKRTTRIPIVTRQCTDASGRMIKIGEISKVPLHHSGPAPEKQAGRFVQSPVQAQAVQMTSQTQAPAVSRSGCQGTGCKPLSAFQRASLVNAPVDRMIGTGSLVQVGVVDPRLHGPNASGWARKGNSMAGQWGGAYLAEKDAEVTEASESDE